MSGRHNLLNALAVCAVALEEGVTPKQIARGFESFAGLKRRQEVRGEVAGVIVVDDFAHHPTAVRETIRAIAARWPDRRVLAIFEPRSNSSRRKVFEEPYSESFDAAAQVFISSPPIRHNDQADTLLDASRVVEMIERRGVPASAHHDADSVLPPLLDALHPGDVALIMSNGSFGGIHDKLLAALRERERVTG
jgi:UDP-N-acetylmuramate: L-alanyl-gamma-D-glutamyl-meso-diaminopimelate ligase